jgi:hypothetical protein
MGDEVSELKSHIKHQLVKGYTPEDIRKALVAVGFPSAEINAAFKPFEQKKTPLLHRLFKPKKEVKIEAVKKTKAKNAGMKKPKQLAGKKPSEETPSLFKIFRQTPLQECELPVRQAPKELPAPEAMKGMTLALPPPPTPQITHHREMSTYLVIILTVIVLTAAILFIFSSVGCMTEKCFIDAANKCEQAKYKNTIKSTTVSYETDGCILIKKITALGPEEPTDIVNSFLGKNMTCRYQQNKFDTLYITSITGLINTCEGELKTAVLQYAV